VTVSIRHCREFIELAEQLNFTKAAQRLGTTQPVLSKHVATLERELGATLVHRGGSSLELTPAGERFLEGCVAVVQMYDDTVADVRRLRTHRSYSLVLTGPFIFPSIVQTLQRAIAACRAEHELDVSMIAEPRPDYLDMLRSRKVDIAFELLSSETDTQGLVSESVRKTPIAVGSLEGHMLSKYGPTIPIAALEGVSIHAPDGPIHRPSRQCFLDLCREHKTSVRLHVKRCGPFDLRLDTLGDDVAILADDVRDYYASPGLQIRSIEEEDCVFDLRAFWRQDSKNPAVPLLVAQLRALAARAPSE